MQATYRDACSTWSPSPRPAVLQVQHVMHAHQRRRQSSRCTVYTRPSLNPNDDEYEFSLTQYMVTLDKPIGLTLAPDPLTGQVFVQAIQEGQSAAESKMIRVGDQLLLVSAATAVLGDDMWPAADLQRTRWAINNRVGKVKLVLERSPASIDSTGKPLPPWYFKGREGIATWQVPELQLPIRFDTDVGGELADSIPGVGRSLSVSFNRCLAADATEQARFLPAGLVARRARAELVLVQLKEAAVAPEVDFVNPVIKHLAAMDPNRFQVGVPSSHPSPAPGSQNVLPFRRQAGRGTSSNNTSGGTSNSNSNSTAPQGNDGTAVNAGSNNAAAAAAAAADQQQQAAIGTGNSTSPAQQLAFQQPLPAGSQPWWPPDSIAIPVTAYRQTRLVQVLPWLMVSTGPLLPADLAQLATTRALSCLLEMQLSTTDTGLLCNRGEPPPPFSMPQEPSPPVLTPSEVLTPAPQTPPPLHVPADQQQLHQAQGAAQQPSSLQDPVKASAAEQQQQELIQDALLAGLASPDLSFATAAMAAAAAAAAVKQQEQQQQSRQEDSNGNSSGVGAAAAGNGYHSMPPGYVTLQAHAVLHCLADLQRLTARRQWRGTGGTARLTNISGNVYSGTYNGYSNSYNTTSSSSTTPVVPAIDADSSISTRQGLAASAGTSSARIGSHSRGSNNGSSSSDSSTEGAAGGLGVSSRQLVLQCEGPEAWQLTGVMLVAWLHWCAGVDKSAAEDSVSNAMGIAVDQVLLSEVQRLLLVRAKERFSRRILSWPYGGATAEVSGELVGGWTERVAMTRCTNPEGCMGASQGHFYLELKGLAPGRYHYKYIIDNTWAVDGLAPKVLDSEGNWNNVLEVALPPRIETPEEKAHYAALQALWSAFGRKMHFKRAGHHSMSL